MKKENQTVLGMFSLYVQKSDLYLYTYICLYMAFNRGKSYLRVESGIYILYC